MSTIFTSLKIWVKTVVFNACLFGFWGLCTGKEWVILLSIAMLFAGFIITAPLFILIDVLVKLSVRLPYRFEAKTTWLAFYLSILIFLFYLLFFKITHKDLFNDIAEVCGFTGITTGSMLIALLTTRKSLMKLNT